MKSFNSAAPRGLVFALLCFGLTGCFTPHKTTHLNNGYEEVAHKSRTLPSMDEPPPVRISFQYMSPKGKLTRIWPSLYGVGEIIHDDLAIFVGDQNYLDGGEAMVRPHLFAVKAPELPVDITHEVLAHWAKITGKNSARAYELFNSVTLETNNVGLVLHLEFANQDYLMEDKNWPDKSAFQLTWTRVSEIMADVKAHGTLKEDPLWHTPFIGEKL